MYHDLSHTRPLEFSKHSVAGKELSLRAFNYIYSYYLMWQIYLKPVQKVAFQTAVRAYLLKSSLHDYSLYGYLVYFLLFVNWGLQDALWVLKTKHVYDYDSNIFHLSFFSEDQIY